MKCSDTVEWNGNNQVKHKYFKIVPKWYLSLKKKVMSKMLL